VLDLPGGTFTGAGVKTFNISSGLLRGACSGAFGFLTDKSKVS
jgi:hypothetical protein